jgi:protein-S-isoprenylcysteine O-methyltransferase Ste14
MITFTVYIVPIVLVLCQVDFTYYDYMLGIPFLRFNTGLKTIGIIMLIIGILFCFVSISTLAGIGKGLPAFILSENLTAKGIYALIRNPMSLGFYIVFLSIGLLKSSISVILWTLIVIIPSHICFLKFFEECELESRFGQPYIEYKKKVPFLIPNLRSIFKRKKMTMMPYNFNKLIQVVG